MVTAGTGTIPRWSLVAWTSSSAARGTPDRGLFQGGVEPWLLLRRQALHTASRGRLQNRPHHRFRGEFIAGAATKKGAWELYDFAADRGETRDHSAKSPEVAKDLAAEWERWAEHSGAKPW